MAPAATTAGLAEHTCKRTSAEPASVHVRKRACLPATTWIRLPGHTLAHHSHSTHAQGVRAAGGAAAGAQLRGAAHPVLRRRGRGPLRAPAAQSKRGARGG